MLDPCTSSDISATRGICSSEPVAAGRVRRILTQSATLLPITAFDAAFHFPDFASRSSSSVWGRCELS